MPPLLENGCFWKDGFATLREPQVSSFDYLFVFVKMKLAKKTHWCMLGLLLVTITSGCIAIKTRQKTGHAAVPGLPGSQTDPMETELQLQRFADDFALRTGHALDHYAQQVGTDSARIEALRLKLSASSALISIASGPNQAANLVDMVSVTVLSRYLIENYWMRTAHGAAFDLWLTASQSLETNVWVLANRQLSPDQVAELRRRIEKCCQRDSNWQTAFYTRPEDFDSLVRITREEEARSTIIFSLVSVDPTEGLAPAVREVTRTRLLAERAMYTLQRMPFLVRMQMELLSYQVAAQPTVQSALSSTVRLGDNAARLSLATESVGQALNRLPERIANERKELLAALSEQEGNLRDLSTIMDRTFLSGSSFNSSLNQVITNSQVLLNQIRAGECPHQPKPDTNSPRPGLLDYAKTAEEIGNTAIKLNTLVESANQSVPQLQKLSEQASSNVREVIDHCFRLGLLLTAELLAGLVAASVLLMYLHGKLRPGRPPE